MLQVLNEITFYMFAVKGLISSQPAEKKTDLNYASALIKE